MIHPGQARRRRPAELPPYLRTLLGRAPECRRLVQSAFPGVCPGLVDEACQETLATAWVHRDRWEAVWRAHGDERLVRWFRLVLWRQVRGWWRQHGRRAVDATELAERVGQVMPAQDVLIRIRCDLGVSLGRAVEAAGGGDGERLRAAVIDGLENDRADTELAERHGVRREYVNRARNALRREVWE